MLIALTGVCGISRGQLIFTENFANGNAWTMVNPGTPLPQLNIANNVFAFNLCSNPGSAERRAFRPIPPLTNQPFRVEFEFRPTQGVGGVGHHIMALTCTNQDPFRTRVANPYNGNSMLEVMYNSNLGGTNYHFMIRSKLPNAAPVNQGAIIPAAALNVTYYCRLERFGSNQDVLLSIFSDPQRTNPIPGSPVCATVPNINCLQFLQIGANTDADPRRTLSAAVDNINIFTSTIGDQGIQPVLNMGSQFSQGQPIMADGTGSTGNITLHQWIIAESDQWWNTDWSKSCNTGWVPGPPGIIDLTTLPNCSGGITFEAGKCYRVVLVVRGNCNDWNDTQQLICLNPPLTAYWGCEAYGTPGNVIYQDCCTPTFGPPPFQFLWSDGNTTPCAQGPPGTVVSLTVTNANGETRTKSNIVLQCPIPPGFKTDGDAEQKDAALAPNRYAIFPNPGKGIIKTNFGEVQSSVRVAVYDLAGNLVYQKDEANTSQVTLDLSRVSKGIYQVRVQTENWVETQRLVMY